MSSLVACSAGIYDCSYRDIPPSELSNCADYDGGYKDMEGRLWIVILSGFVMCAMAFGMGSNDAGRLPFLFFSSIPSFEIIYLICSQLMGH